MDSLFDEGVDLHYRKKELSMEATHLGSNGHAATGDTGTENVQNTLKLVIPWLRQLAAKPSPCGICGGQSGTETGFPPSYSAFLLTVSCHQCSILICLSVTNAI